VSCRLPDGRDDPSKSSELLELYALQCRISALSNNTLKLQALYEKTKNLNAAVKDPKSVSVIKEYVCGTRFSNGVCIYVA